MIATGGTDGSVMFWDAASGISTEPSLPELPASCRSRSARTVNFLLLRRGGTVRIFDPKSRKELFVMSHDEGPYGISFSPDGKRLVSAAADQTVKLWDTMNRRVLFLRCRSKCLLTELTSARTEQGFLFFLSIMKFLHTTTVTK